MCHATPPPWHGLQNSVLQDQCRTWNHLELHVLPDVWKHQASSHTCYSESKAIRYRYAAANNLSEPIMPQILHEIHFHSEKWQLFKNEVQMITSSAVQAFFQSCSSLISATTVCDDERHTDVGDAWTSKQNRLYWATQHPYELPNCVIILWIIFLWRLWYDDSHSRSLQKTYQGFSTTTGKMNDSLEYYTMDRF